MTPTMKLVMDLSTLQSKILKRVDSQLSLHGISFTEFTVMFKLSTAPNNTMRRIELAESVNLSASGVTRLLLPMVKTGLVEKEINPRDARVSLVRLSDTGARMLQDALVSFEHSTGTMMQSLGTRQVEQFLNLTEKLLGAGPLV